MATEKTSLPQKTAQVEASVPDGLEKRNFLPFEELCTVHEQLGTTHLSVAGAFWRLQLIEAFVLQEGEKHIGEPIQIHAIALCLKDILNILEPEVDNLEKLHMDTLPYRG
ncbi:hypothetical protein [Desulfovibrio intestinalis]|uniref:Uncharacterized protein n=1 Tax=Desulfovibrio intestinalis TaxID=58621 RepID=A0A7W8C187_9BACT|nr:hypothetical protein [Desulfovibrio intestinalis]MBB5142524.1 hypothetical protein [Desulfovibrio intestinalis]